MGGEKPFIKLLNVSYDYQNSKNKVKALDKLNMEIRSGEFLAVVGPNGSGKSTLVKLFNALLVPTKGQVLVDGLDSHNQDQLFEIRKKVGMVFQNPENQLVSAVLEEEIAFGPENLGLSEIDIRNRVNSIIKALDLEEFKNRPLHYLSGGEKQKVAIAGVLALQPSCIIFDESTSMLDFKSRQEILQIINNLKDQGTTIIMVTHFMAEALQADRIIILKHGKILTDSSPRELVKSPYLLKSMKTDLSPVREIAWRLQKNGLPVDEGIIFFEELVNEICRLKKEKFLIVEKDNFYLKGEINSRSAAGYLKEATADNAVKIELQNVTYTYSKGTPFAYKALDNISLKIKSSGITAIIGPPGSGKSTLMQTFIGLLKPSQGKIFIDGQDIKKINKKELRKTIGLVFQQPENQFFAETVRQEVSYALENLASLPQQLVDKQVSNALRAVGLDLEEIGERSPFSLSGGQKRRVALAGVLALEPKILILDEPTSGLDPEGSKKLMEYLKYLKVEKEMTIILVSHNIEDVYQYADEVVLMHKGTVITYGPTRKVLLDQETLNNLGVEVPTVLRFLNVLREKGLLLRKQAYTLDEVVEEVLSCFRTKGDII